MTVSKREGAAWLLSLVVSIIAILGAFAGYTAFMEERHANKIAQEAADRALAAAIEAGDNRTAAQAKSDAGAMILFLRSRNAWTANQYSKIERDGQKLTPEQEINRARLDFEREWIDGMGAAQGIPPAPRE
jgi:predicted Zn-dependent peptidase